MSRALPTPGTGVVRSARKQDPCIAHVPTPGRVGLTVGVSCVVGSCVLGTVVVSMAVVSTTVVLSRLVISNKEIKHN